jgi:pimeloyl-ACP methyl ester carboxylesterase
MSESVRDSSFAEIPGVRLAYEVGGAGAPVIFLHGGLLDLGARQELPTSARLKLPTLRTRFAAGQGGL